MKRQFIQWSRAWWNGDTLRRLNETEKITIGLYGKNGSTAGEFCIRWVPLSGESCAQLTVFEDAWAALSQFEDVLKGLAKLNGTNPSPEKIVKMLRKCGVEYATPEKQP